MPAFSAVQGSQSQLQVAPQDSGLAPDACKGRAGIPGAHMPSRAMQAHHPPATTHLHHQRQQRCGILLQAFRVALEQVDNHQGHLAGELEGGPRRQHGGSAAGGHGRVERQRLVGLG